MKCAIEDCNTEAKYGGLCGMHYKRQWRHGDPAKTLTPTRGFIRIECIVDGCVDISAYGNGLCEVHYQQQNRYGRTYNIIAPKGSGHISSAGYIVHTINGKPKYEHIILAEIALGKPLPKGAVVHHMNNEPWDNHKPFNLVICPDQAYHMLLHKRARELGYENN